MQWRAAPWGDWKAGKALTPNQLARLLKPFGVAPQGTIRVSTRTAKGYYRNQLETLWDRYLADQGVRQPSHRHNPHETYVFGDSEPSQADLVVTDGKREKPLWNGHCDGVTVQKGGVPVCVHCGRPEGPTDPVLDCSVDGEIHLLHPGCQKDWLSASPPGETKPADDGLDIPECLRRA
jgi:hypothetical protein